MNEIQKQVAEAVKARGYWDGLSWEPLVCRHVAKLTEELGEAAEYMYDMRCEHGGTMGSWHWQLGMAGIDSARSEFDEIDNWPHYRIKDVNALKKELADLQVVLLSMSTVLEFDILAAALEKARADVERGVR